MPTLDNTVPTRLFDIGMGSQTHDMLPDLNIGAFQPEEKKNSMMFEAAMNWQAMGDAGLTGYVDRLTRLRRAAANNLFSASRKHKQLHRQQQHPTNSIKTSNH